MLMLISHALISVTMVTNILSCAFYKRLSERIHILVRVFTVLAFSVAFLLGEIIHTALNMGGSSIVLAAVQIIMLISMLGFVAASLLKKRLRKKLYIAITTSMLLCMALCVLYAFISNGSLQPALL